MTKPDKRDDIIRAAMELIAEHGFHGAPMALVAERAGVAAGTIYRYFASKDDLIREIYACLEKQFFEALAEDYPAEQGVREQFLHIWRALLRYFITSPMEFRFVEQFHNSPYGVTVRRERLQGHAEGDLIVRLFTSARDRKILKELPLPILSALSFGPLINVSRDHILGLLTLDEALIEQTIAACWDGVKRSPGEPSEKPS